MGETYRITPILCGTLRDVEHSNVTLKRHEGQKISIPSILWLISGGGENVVIDSGPGDPAIVRSRLGKNFDREEAPGRLLSGTGVDPGEITIVVVSHLHWDHSGDLELFPKADIYVQRRELEWAVAPAPIQRDLYELHRTAVKPPRWVESLTRIKVINGDHQLMPGLRLLLLPGHTPGIMGAAVDTTAGRYVITSDAVPTFENWRDGIPPGWYVDLRDCYETFGRIREFTDDLVLPAHDFKSLEQPSYPAS